MKHLLRIEFRKVFKNNIFWLTLGLYILGMIIILIGTESFINKVVSNANRNSPIPIPDFSLYAFPYIWHNLTYLGGFFKIILAFIVILFISNEFNYNTIRQNIITGLSRERFFISKVFFLIFLTFVSCMIIVVVVIILGFTHTDDISISMVIIKSHFLAAYFLEVFAFLSFSMALSFIFKRAGVTIIVFSIYLFIVENILSFKIHEDYSKYLPLKTFGRLIDIPNTSLMKLFGVNFREFVDPFDIVLTLIYSIILLTISYLIIKKSNW